MLLTVVLIAIEIIIAALFHDRIIRPYIGDVLVVILLFCFCKTFIKGSSVTIALAVLIFACVIETLQYFQFINFLGLQKSGLAGLILGHSFDWADIICYIIGFVIVLFIETIKAGKRRGKG